MNMAKILLALTINFLVVFNSHAITPTGTYGVGTGTSAACYDIKNFAKTLPVATSYGYVGTASYILSCSPLTNVTWSYLYSDSSLTTLNGNRVAMSLTCPANSTLSGSTCTCQSGYTEQAGACVQQTPINACENTTEQDLVYKATNNAEVKNPTLIPTSEYQDLCHDSCRFQLQGTVERCFALISDSSPRPGYCQQSYTPTYQICTAGEIYKASLQITPPADVTTCPTNHTLNDFDICTPDELICPADQAPNAQNICENVACQSGYIRETPESPCTSNACPAGQYRLNDDSPCQPNATCGNGQASYQSSCLPNQCQEGYYRDSITQQCQQSNGLNFGMCNEITNTQLSNCAKQSGLTSYLVPTSKYCAVPRSGYMGLGDSICQIRSTPTENFDADGNVINKALLPSSITANLLTPQNALFAITNPSSPSTGYSNAQSWEAVYTSKCTDQTKILTSGGQCVPQSCLTDPTSSPTCGETGGGGSSTGDMGETNTLLTNIKNLLDGSDTDGSISDGLGDTLTQLQQDAFTTNLAALETWFDESPIVEAFESILPESPWQAIEEGANGDCMYESQVLGHTFNLSLCDNQQVIHPLIAFMMFIAVSWGIMILIFEKDNA